MRYLFTPTMEKQLKEFVQPGTLLAFDYDGTLAPIVAKPGAATLGVQTRNLLSRLCDQAPVAVLSGRGAQDVRERVPYPLVAVIGNHGMEGVKAHRSLAKQAAKAVKAWDKELKGMLDGQKGVFAENKKYSLTVHYRAARDREAAAEKIFTNLAHLDPPARLLPGKCVVNVMIPRAPHKGTALLDLLRTGKFQRAFFAGDDDTDEDVFRLRDPRIFSLRVGKRTGSPAQAFVESQSEMRRVLRFLLDLVESQQG